ncbi:MAG: FHA domain-containing protein [Chloroflexota bacterium]
MNTLDNLSTASQTCVNCQTVCGADELYCLFCGYILPKALKSVQRTQNLDGTANRNVDLQWGTGYFHDRANLYLRLVDNQQVIPVPFETRSIILGRERDGTNATIDLTPFGAREQGVSRRHVRIDRLQDFLQVVDLESANGTFINRNRIAPGVVHTLRNRAVLQLGKMILRVQFA